MNLIKINKYFIVFFSTIVGGILFINLFPYTNQVGFKLKSDPISIAYMLGKSKDFTIEENRIYRLSLSNTNKNINVHITIAPSISDNSSIIYLKSDYVKKIFYNRLLNWTGFNNDFNELKQKAIEIRNAINKELIKYKIAEIKLDQLENTNCLCKKFYSSIDKKAEVMNKNIDVLAYFLGDEKKSSPIIVIDDLNFNDDLLEFNLCFKVNKNFTIEPNEHKVFVKYFDFTTINHSASIYGNYKLSHFNWARVINQINMSGSNPTFPMVEEFNDNPFNGGNDLQWKSKLYYTSKN